MKKTLITLLALSGLAMGSTDVAVESSITLDGTQATDTRLDFKYSTNADQSVTTTVDNVTIYGTDGYGLKTTDTTLTFNIQYNLKATGAIKVAETGDTSEIIINTTITDAELSALAEDDIASRWVVEADVFTNIAKFVNNDNLDLNLNGLSGYTDGGYIYDLSGTYYAASDVTLDGSYASVNQNATAIKLADGTLYTTLKITDDTGAAVKGIGYIATAAVPEPTTATLSLLALAGLAARRRRK